MVIWGGDSSKFYLLSKNNPWRYICSAIRVLQSVCWRTLVSSEHLHTAVCTLTGQWQYSQTCHNNWKSQLVMYSTALLLCQGLNSTCCYIHCLWFVWEAAPTYLGLGHWSVEPGPECNSVCIVLCSSQCVHWTQGGRQWLIDQIFSVIQNFPIISHWVQKLDELQY